MDVLLNGNSCIDQLENGHNRITIPHTHSSIEIKVISMEKDVFRSKLYRYMINGTDQQYTETYNHVLSLRMLAPGNYSILVSCNSKSGEWSEPVEVLHITGNTSLVSTPLRLCHFHHPVNPLSFLVRTHSEAAQKPENEMADERAHQ